MTSATHPEPIGAYGRLENKLCNSALVSAREEIGLGRSALASELGISHMALYMIETLRIYPSLEQQQLICGYYRGNGVFMIEEEVFPTALVPYAERGGKRLAKNLRANGETASGLLLNDQRRQNPATSETQALEEEQNRVIHDALSKLDPRYEMVVRQYLGVDGQEQNQTEIAHGLEVTSERVRQIIERSYIQLEDHLQLYDPRDRKTNYQTILQKASQQLPDDEQLVIEAHRAVGVYTKKVHKYVTDKGVTHLDEKRIREIGNYLPIKLWRMLRDQDIRMRDIKEYLREQTAEVAQPLDGEVASPIVWDAQKAYLAIQAWDARRASTAQLIRDYLLAREKKAASGS